MNRRNMLLVLAGLLALGAASAATAIPDPAAERIKAAAVNGSAVEPQLADEKSQQTLAETGFREYRDSVTKDQYFVDKNDNTIRAYFNQEAYAPRNSQTESRMPEQEVLAKAESLAKRQYLGGPDELAHMERDVQYRVIAKGGSDRGKKSSEMAEYVVIFRLIDDDVTLPSFFRAVFNSDGMLRTFSQQDEEVLIPHTETITKAQVLEIMSDKFRMPVYSVDRAERAIVAYPDGHQQLLWRLELHTGDGTLPGSRVAASIDANSGEIVSSSE